MRKIKKNSLALNILKTIGIAGLFLVAATSPFFGLNLIKGIMKGNERQRRLRFYHSLRYLNKRGLVQIIHLPDGGMNVKITQMGRQVLEKVDIDTMELKNKTIDGIWRIVIFDVPVKKSDNRRAFTDRIGSLGFIMIQKSVWVCPYECYKEIMILRKFFEIEKHVTYLESNKVEDEDIWRSKYIRHMGDV